MSDAQSSKPIRRRLVGKPFEKGKSGNPGGRPKGLADTIRKLTKDGRELIDLHLEVMRGTLKIKRIDGYGMEIEQLPLHKDRMMAAQWLADRGFGKVPEVTELTLPNQVIDVRFANDFEDQTPETASQTT